jgi:hypothetical protein
MMLTTEVEFSLPCGYVDSEGVLHKEGVMRLATAGDEILPAKDPRVLKNPAYLVVIVLSRVITRLGTLREINPGIIEVLYAKDVAYLQELYNQLNGYRTQTQQISCPECQAVLEWEANSLGGSAATP